MFVSLVQQFILPLCHFFIYIYLFIFKLEQPMEGLKEWLDAVYTARIPCAIVSSLDRRNMVEALERMELKKYFQVGDFFLSFFPVEEKGKYFRLHVMVTPFRVAGVNG